MVHRARGPRECKRSRGPTRRPRASRTRRWRFRMRRGKAARRVWGRVQRAQSSQAFVRGKSSRDSSAGRASDRRSEGPRLDP
eukprot:5017341-Karenia_brevis.AAC.1